MRTVHNVTQGSEAWHALRAKHDCASEAPVVMGESPHMTRSELVRLHATGDEREISSWQEKLFAEGHEVEAFARRVIEEETGDDLYPATISEDDKLASFDGMPMDEGWSLEVKLWNKELVAYIEEHKDLPPSHWPQVEQQLDVGDVDHVLFVVTDGTRENFKRLTYRAVPGRLKAVYAAWKQFREDVKNYKPVEVLPPVTAEPVLALPSLAVRVEGQVSLRSNLGIFAEQLKSYIDGLVMAPSTDQEFANGAAAVKTLEQAEDALEAARVQARGQIVSVDELERQIEHCKQIARTARLALNSAVETRKKAIRAEIHAEGIAKLTAHVKKLNERLGRPFMAPPDSRFFVEEMKGKKTVAGLRDAMETALAKRKIECNEAADSIEANLKIIATDGAGFEMLFADVERLVNFDADHLRLTVKTRIADHERAEAQRKALAEEKAASALAEKDIAAAQGGPVQMGQSSRPPLTVVQGVGRTTAAVPKPPDETIIEAMSLHWAVPAETVISWLRAMDLDIAQAALARRRAAE